MEMFAGGLSDREIPRDRLPTATISKRCYHVCERVMSEGESMRGPFLLTVTVFAAIGELSTPTAAQTWPTHPLTLVVPFAAGGPSDVAGRIIAQRLSEVFGQQVVVENPSGAGGTVGSNRIAKAAPDGYQFVIGNIGTHAWSQSLYKKPPYNTLADFV